MTVELPDSPIILTDKPFKLTDKQQEGMVVLSSGAKEILLVGGARSGKSLLLCRAISIRAQKSPNSRHAILRFRFNHCKQSIVLDTWPKMHRLCFPGLPHHINQTDWYDQYENGSQIWFGGLDDKERTEKILGMEFVTIFLNECSQISQPSYSLVKTRLAQACNQEIKGLPSIPLQPKMLLDCNPPKKNHWTYRLFVKKQDLDTRQTLKTPDEYAYLVMNPRDNIENQASGFIETLEGLGSAMRKRFLDGEFGEITENGLLDDMVIDRWRIVKDTEIPQMVRIVIAVDPSGSGDKDNETNAAIGIVAAGLGIDGKGYLLADLTVKCGPATWGRIVTDAFERWKANVVVAETNFGGAMVEHVIQVARPRTPYKSVNASRGKQVRAEPVAALVEEGRIRHAGYFPELEEELANFTTNGYIGENSPNRADAYFWAFTELFGEIVAVHKKIKKHGLHYGAVDNGVGC